MDILNRSGRIPDLEDELNFIQQQRKQYISLVDLREEEVTCFILLDVINTSSSSVWFSTMLWPWCTWWKQTSLRLYWTLWSLTEWRYKMVEGSMLP